MPSLEAPGPRRHALAVALQIKLEMSGRGMDQKALSVASRVPESSLSRYLMGQRNMSLVTFSMLAAALGVAPGVLLNRVDLAATDAP